MADGLVLGLDTSTVVAVGLARDGQVLGRAVVEDRLAHVEQLMVLVSEVLAAAQVGVRDLDRLLVGLGPGPFTGLRVGIATARVLAAASGVELRGVCSLDVLAAQHASDQHAADQHTATGPGAATDFLVATDARRREVYWARYSPTGVRLDGPSVSSPDDVPALPVVGPGAVLYADRLTAVPGPAVLDAGVLASRGSGLADAGTEPLYLRRPDAAAPAARKSVLTFRAPGRSR